MARSSRVEEVIHVVVAKPIAWTLLWSWWLLCWIGRGVVQAERWARQR
jgi:hypothetical protein